MHETSKKINPSFYKDMHKEIKESNARNNCEVSVATWVLSNCSMQCTPHSPLISVVLKELFPVLEGPIDDIPVMSSYLPEGSAYPRLHVLFDTLLHGQVMLKCLGFYADMTMKIVRQDVDGKEALCMHVHSNNTGLGYCAICVSLIFQRGRCRMCGKDAKRCARCWKKLRVPVWYCCAKCQADDYPRHRHECGRIVDK
jgi:hypothetical protein